MDWKRHYERLIERARDRTIEGYSELHHVVPKCMGGSDKRSNLVRLTPEEHFVAHLLLIKVHPGNRGLVYSVRALMMCGRTKGRSLNKEVGWVRRLMAKATGDAKRGIPRDAETRRKNGLAHKGRKLPASQKAAIAAALKGKTKSPEHVAKVSAALMGKLGTRRGVVLSEETKQKMREAALRRYHPDGKAPPAPIKDPKKAAAAHKAWATKRAKLGLDPPQE